MKGFSSIPNRTRSANATDSLNDLDGPYNTQSPRELVLSSMETFTGTAYLAFSTLPIIGIWLLLRYNRDHRRGSLPPGPSKLPLIGNLHHVPSKRQWETFFQLSRKYGSGVISIEDFGLTFVIVNSWESAQDLLNQRSKIYSSRPRLPVIHELKGWGDWFALAPYGDHWRAGRRMFTNFLTSDDVKLTQKSELRYLRRFLCHLLESPGRFDEHVAEYSTSTGLSLTYGFNSDYMKGDPYRDVIKPMMEQAIDVLNVGGFLSTVIPGFKDVAALFPNTRSQRVTAMLERAFVSAGDRPFHQAEAMWNAGNCQSSFVSQALEEAMASGMNDQERKLLLTTASISWLGLVMTSIPTMMTFFLAMTLNPDAQRAAQHELDTVLGERLPTHDDLKSLPYVAAVLREVLRWRPVIPLGVPHQVIQDDCYRDMLIPKDSIVIGNQWAMTRDEELYPNPEAFSPRRHLKDGKLNLNVLNPGDIIFGFGRRACPGRYLAESVLQLTFASILACFSIGKEIDGNGCEVEPEAPYCDYPHYNPSAFACRIQPRSEKVAEMIRSIDQA